MKRISMSTPFFLKMPASSASFRGWKPVQPLMPSTTFSCAWAANATAAANTTANHFIFVSPRRTRHSNLALALGMTRIVRAPRGTELSARSWLTEAPLRMLMNNLDPEVAERPEDLVVYGGIGKAARNWECYDAIVASLRKLGPEETLLVQSGKPVG